MGLMDLAAGSGFRCETAPLISPESTRVQRPCHAHAKAGANRPPLRVGIVETSRSSLCHSRGLKHSILRAPEHLSILRTLGYLEP